MHDVVILGHRPIGLNRRVGAVMHRLFLAQPLEKRPQDVVLEQPWRAGMKILQRRGIGLFTRQALTLGLAGSDCCLDVHLPFPMMLSGRTFSCAYSVRKTGTAFADYARFSRRCGPAGFRSL